MASQRLLLTALVLATISSALVSWYAPDQVPFFLAGLVFGLALLVMAVWDG